MTTKATPAKKILSLSEYLNQAKIEFVEIPGVVEGTFLRIGSVTAGDMMEWAEENDGPKKRSAGIRLIVKSLVDENGTRIGRDEDIPTLMACPVKYTEGILKHIVALNGMNAKETADAKNS